MDKVTPEELTAVFEAMSPQERAQTLVELCDDAFGSGASPCDAYETDMMAGTLTRLRVLQRFMEQKGEDVSTCPH